MIGPSLEESQAWILASFPSGRLFQTCCRNSIHPFASQIADLEFEHIHPMHKVNYVKLRVTS